MAKTKTLCSITFSCGCKYRAYLTDKKIQNYKETMPNVKVRKLPK